MVNTRSAGPATLAVALDGINSEKLASVLPDVDLINLTPDGALSLYKLILAQLEDSLRLTQENEHLKTSLDDAKAEIEKKDVELDQAYQDRDTSSREFETKLVQVGAELESTKKLLDEANLQSIKFKQEIADSARVHNTNTADAATLQQRLADVEREKRELMSLFSRLQEDTSKYEKEVQTLRANLKQARQDHSALEAEVRDLRATETSTKFKVDTLQQQLTLSQSSNERLTAELTDAHTSLTSFRRSKQVELSTLQISFDELTSAHAANNQALSSLRAQHSKQTSELSHALGRIQDLQGRLAEQEAGYSNEAANLRRLVDAMEEREKQTKEEVEAIEREWETLGERSERKESTLRSEIDRERRAREEAEHRVERLSALLERMNDPLAELSPTVALASQSQRAGKTFTEVYADYVRLQEDYARKSAEYDHMDRTLSSVLVQIEERAPLLSQQRIEYERLQYEASQVASQLSQTIAERDTQLSLSRDISHKLSASQRENELLQHQLSDVGRQVQHLLGELAKRDDPTLASATEDDSVAEATDIDSVITNNLVLFHSINSLQDQNQKLLKITRELGSKLEREERDYEGRMAAEQAEAVKEAHEAITNLSLQLENQKRSADLRISAYAKEAEVLRSRLERATTTMPQQPVDPDLSIASSLKEKAFAEIQTRFDVYREETTVDANRIREDLLEAQRCNSRLTTALAKANAKVEFVLEQQRLSAEQLKMQRTEMEGFAQRNGKLFEDFTRVNMEYNRVTDDLIAANNLVEQLRTQCSNLKAEKSIWEGSNDRLISENKSLMKERTHLSDLMASIQKMHNDLEHAGEGDKRRLEGQVQMMESQLLDLRNQLTQERESVRHVTLQKEIEVKELYNRLETANGDYARNRELLVRAEATLAHLEEKSSDSSKQNQGLIEKLAVYERRQANTGSSEMNFEIQLESEVADLRSALKVAEVDLINARAHVQQFQEISQANESALSNLSKSFDEYKIASESQLAQLESDLRSAQDAGRRIQVEGAESVEKMNAMQSAFDKERSAWQADRRTLEGTIVSLSASEQDSVGDRTLREKENTNLRERMSAAEERYSREVLAHAEAIKTNEKLREDLTQVQAGIRHDKSAAEAAHAKLAASESSWAHQRQVLEKELQNVQARCKDLSDQNDLLHQHLESVSSQAAKIQNAVIPLESQEEADNGDSSDRKFNELRSVVAYLRKEKEIVDLQLELGKQENTRLKSQVNHLTKALDDARNSLAQERERATASAGSDAQHKELIERINQLNILRESNSTLRADSQNYAKQASDLQVQLKQLTAEIEPVREAAKSAKAEIAARDARIAFLEEESRRWQDRNSQLLSKYDRIDPAEVQSLRDEIETLKAQKAASDANAQEYMSQNITQAKRLEALEANVLSYKSTLQRNNEGARSKITSLNADNLALREQIKSLTAAQDTTQSSDETQKLRRELESLRTENVALQSTLQAERVKATPPDRIAEQENRLAVIIAERDQLAAEKSSWISSTSGDHEVPDKSNDEQRQELINQRDAAVIRANATAAQLQKAEAAAKGFKLAYDKAQQRLSDLSKARALENDRAAATQAAAVQAALEQQRATLQTSDSQISSQESAAHTAQMEALRQSLETAHQEELLKAIEKARETERNLAIPSSKPEDLSLSQATVAAAVQAHDEAMKAQHADELTKAMDSGRKEMAMKIKLKDQALVRAQARVKDLESQILDWKKRKLIPESVPTSAPVGSVVKTAAEGEPLSSPAVKASSSSSVPISGSLPIRGVARGVSRGGAVRARGSVARGGAGRGATPSRGGAPQTNDSPAGTSTLSIIGAASKRPRDESEEDALAKRVKPTENGAKPIAPKRPVAPPAP